MNKLAHNIVDSIDAYADINTDSPNYVEVDNFISNVCVMQLTQAMPDAFGRDIIKTCPADGISGKFGCQIV